jgi:hypothetical protein
MPSSNDTYIWTNQYGGSWATAANWTDTTTGTTATSAPGATNAVSITGGPETYTNITGTGAAAQLAVADEVLFWGTVTVGGAVTLAPSTDLELDGRASLAAGSLKVGQSGSLEAGNGSTVQVSGGATLDGGFLLATGASTVQVGALIANNGSYGSTIAVDDDSSVEVGKAGGAALGAITIDKGQRAAVSGTIDGNVVVKGTLGVQAGHYLDIDPAYSGDPFGNANTISGSGTLALSENSTLDLGVADSAAIQFSDPSGTLDLSVLPTGTISGFAAGDTIEMNGLATGLSYKQTSASVATLTLTRGGKAVGTLTLAGSYTASLFHLSLGTYGAEFITLQTIGSAPTPPSLITGTPGSDILYATANGQTLTGLGGNDTLSGGTYAGLDFKDTSADLNGSTIYDFAASDVVDLTDMKPGTASASYTPGYYVNYYTYVPGALTVTDGTHSATIGLSFYATQPIGYFAASTDGASGTDVKYVTVNTDAYAFSATLGGSYSVAANWMDTTTGSTATAAPSYGNGVTIAGGSAYTDVTGNGFAASLTTSGAVLLWGSLAVGSKVSGVSGALSQTGTLALDGGANLVLAGEAQIGGSVEVGGGSKLTAAGGIAFSNDRASLLAIGGSSVQFANVFGGGYYSNYYASTIGVDSTSSIEFGTAGGAATGALKIDSGVTADLAGTIDGNVVVNGVLDLEGNLAVNAFGTAAPSVSGSGTLEIGNYDTLTLAGSDSAAILFQSAYSATLALTGSLPTGTISGFTQGDAITLARPVTGLSYSQTGTATGKLTLYDGATKVGTLLLAGSYTASQFQVQSQSSTITYSPTPGTNAGTQVSSNSDTYYWENASGGVWSNASNWYDSTSGKTPTTAPGAGNTVVIDDSSASSSPQIISGSGAAASLYVYENTVFTGDLTVGGEFYTDSSDVALAGGAVVTAGGLTDSSALQVGDSTLTVGNAEIRGSLSVVGGSKMQVTAGLSSYISGTVAVDGYSSFEIGSSGSAAKGALTIDKGQSPSIDEGTIAANLVLNGALLVNDTDTIEGFGGAVGSVTGTGTIELGETSYYSNDLVLNAADSAAIAFYSPIYSGYVTSLELKGPLPTGTISGFVAGDTIQVDQTVTGVSFNQTTGKLTLTDGATTVGTLTFSGIASGSLFQVDVAAATGVATISLQTATTSAGTAAASTGKDAYSWVGAAGGSWTNAANWTDTTTNTTPTTVPGSGDAVTIAGSGNAQYTSVGGKGAAASLATSGHVLLTGQVAVTAGVAVSQTAELALDAGATLTAASAALDGTLSAGHGSSAKISGTATLTGGSLLALDDSTVQVGALIGDGSGNVIAVDANSTIKIGSPSSAAAGALTEAAGATAAFNGAIYGSVVTAGTLAVAGGGALFIDMTGTAASDPYASKPTISGTGTLLLTEGSTLGLGVADRVAIQFAGPDATLQLAAIPTATITGFAAGDAIQLDQTVTGLRYKQVTSTSATLTLTNGAATVGTLELAGNYSASSDAFHLDAAANGATAVISLQTIGIAATQPTLIEGTAASDLLSATANGQTITGLGGDDTLSGGSFTGIDFKDLTANLNGSAIQNFATSDLIDFTNMTESKASVTYAKGVLTATDGTHAATLSLGFLSTPTTGGFAVTHDAGTGTEVYWKS